MEGQGIGFRILRPIGRIVPQELAKRYWEPDHPEIINALEVKQKFG